MKRRKILKGGMVLIATATVASIFRPIGAAAKIFTGGQPWPSPPDAPVAPVDREKLVYFTQIEAAQVSAIFDRLIPADEITPSATQAGCVTFIDHQLAAPYGNAESRYKLGPVIQGSAAQGMQSLLTPAELYRRGLSAMDQHCRASHGNAFAELADHEKDAYLEMMENGALQFDGIDAKAFFNQLLTNVKEGFLADPLYGGNRDMVGWKMVGFPGARYDYRAYINRKGEVLNIPPVSLYGEI